MLDGFTPEEIEIVLAHEIGHHVHRHVLKFLAAGLLYSLVAFYLCDVILRHHVPVHREGEICPKAAVVFVAHLVVDDGTPEDFLACAFPEWALAQLPFPADAIHESRMAIRACENAPGARGREPAKRATASCAG